MRCETEYLVSAKSVEAIGRICDLWGYKYAEGDDDLSFEDYAVDAFDVMEKVIKLVHQMETIGQKDEFTIVGKIDTDYDCSIFSIEYAGEEPLIKAAQADPDFNEARYDTFCDAFYDEIPGLLKRNKNRTFKQAIKDELPLGGFLDVSYDEWYKSILAE